MVFPFGKTAERELELLKKVLSVLLSGKGSAVHSVSVGGFVHCLVSGPQHFAAERLIAEFDSNGELATLMVESYLDRFEKSPHALFRDVDAIEYACRIAEQFYISGTAAERLVGCIAEAGWYGRLESCARKYCNRKPKPEEVVRLFASYVKGASQSTSTEEVLAGYAKKYLSPAQTQEQMRLIAERNHQWNTDCY